MKKFPKLILIDNDQDYVESLGDRLQKEGFEVSSIYHENAMSTLEELRHLLTEEKQILITDLNMRDISGPELVKLAKRLASFRNVDIIPVVMTNKPNPNLEMPVIDKGWCPQAIVDYIGNLSH